MAKKRKLDPIKNEKNKSLKIAIGERFKEFRQAIGMPQHQLAKQIDVYQSTITSIERGKTYPGINYLYHFYEVYGLNIHWLLTGEGHKFVLDYTQRPDVSYVMESSVKYGEPLYDEYIELLKLMQIPEIEKVILSKLIELKATFREEVQKFLEKKKL